MTDRERIILPQINVSLSSAMMLSFFEQLPGTCDETWTSHNECNPWLGTIAWLLWVEGVELRRVGESALLCGQVAKGWWKCTALLEWWFFEFCNYDRQREDCRCGQSGHLWACGRIDCPWASRFFTNGWLNGKKRSHIQHIPGRWALANVLLG